MEHTVKFKIDDRRIKARLDYELSQETDNFLRIVLNDGSDGNKKGELFEAIEQSLVQVINDPRTTEIINRVIKRDWERLLEEATITALTHKANRVAFSAAKNPLELGRSV
jgi:hypothetical protein